MSMEEQAGLREAIMNEGVDPKLLKSFFKRHVEFERYLNKLYEFNFERLHEIENAALFYLLIESDFKGV